MNLRKSVGKLLPVLLLLSCTCVQTIAQSASTTGECWSACEARALAGFVTSQNSTSVNSSSEYVGMQLFEENSSTPFRFISVNAPNLHRLELSSSNSQLVGKPSRAEIWDVLCSVQQLGGTVVRAYTLSFGNDSTFHIQGQEPTQVIGQQNQEILPDLTFNEGWFEVLDTVLEAAGNLGIRVVFPFINMVDLSQWGGAASLSRWSNVPTPEFFDNEITKSLYKQVVNFVITRRNTLTGTLYRDDPAIFGWELGNELFSAPCDDVTVPICGQDRPIRAYSSVPVSWTEEMSDYIRSLDPNHLIIDGAYPKDSDIMDLPNIDIMGATYYEGNSAQLLADVDFIGGRKVMVAKEFGLAGSTTFTAVQEMVQAVVNETAIAGALYWSLRGHAEDGGFYWHYEQSVDEAGLTVYPTSLHWPGFSEELPTYENQVLELLVEASSQVGGPSPPDSVPCTPQVELVPGDFFPPCLSMVGSTGASRYELWITEVDEYTWDTNVPYLEVQESWLRVQRDAHDATAERSAALSFFLDDNVRTLFGWAGNTWRICAAACNKNGNCSACTVPMDLTMDVSGDLSPLCLTSFSNTTMADEDQDYLGRYLFSLPRPESWLITTGALFAVCMASAIALLVMCRSSVQGAVAKALSCYTRALNPSSNHGQADALHVGSKASFLWASEFAGLKAFAVVLLILHCRRYDVHSPSWPLSAVVEWASMSYSFLFLMAGFVLGSEQLASACGTKTTGTSQLALRCFWKRAAHLCPALSVSCIIGFFLEPESLTGSYLLLPLGLTAWFPSMWENDVNGPAWIVGALAFNGLVLLPVLDAIRESKPSARTRMWLLVTCWLATLWQANDVLGQRLFLLDRFIIAIFLRSFAPSFIAGVILASLFAERTHGSSTAFHLPGSSVTPAVALVFMSLIPLENDFLKAWVRSGALIPLQALLLYGVASMDALTRTLSFVRIPAPVDVLSMLVLQQCTWSIVSDLVGGDLLSWIVFCLVLPVFSSIVNLLVCRPCANMILSSKILTPDCKISSTASTAARKRTDTENLVLYYASFVLIVVTFCVAQFYDPWVTVADLSDAAWLPTFLEAFSWILLAPAPALLMGLGGLLRYPAVLQPRAQSLDEQVAAEAEKIPSIEEDPPFKIHFRIVTRGNNPNLVLGNCETALEVLRSSSLPADRWGVEVVTDKAMGLPAQCDVTEIVVPTDYDPPGGCKFKARALNYAVNGSSARYQDWIVHLDEETRFDGDTVAHIFEHCRKQHSLVESGESKFPSIGQGVIYYNKAGIENYLTALADTIRVADDYAKFALQYRMFRLPLIGMHGSFVVCCNSLQRDVGWDWGMTGSITEDTYLAMKLAAMGVKFDFCGGNMYEQSPFSCLDFAKQRARWFSGLWLCVVTNTLPLWQRVFLGSHLASWSLCPLLTFVTWVNLLTIFPRTQQFIYMMSFVFSIPFWSYCLGFALGFSPSQFKHGRIEWLLLFIIHVTMIPVYTVMETYGVARGILDRKTYVGFHIVQKEGNIVKKNQAQKENLNQDVAEDSEPSGNAEGEHVVDMDPGSPDALQHWRQVYQHPVESLDLGHGLSSPVASESSLVHVRDIVISTLNNQNIDIIAKHAESSPRSVVAAIFAAFLRRYVRQEEFLVGVWQPDRKLEALPLRTSLSMDAALSTIVAEVTAAMNGSDCFSSIKLEELVLEFGAKAKIFQASISHVSPAFSSFESRWIAKQSSVTDLAVVCASSDDSITLRALFNPALHQEAAIDSLLSSFATFLSAALANTAEPVKLLPLMSQNTRRVALKSFYEEAARACDESAAPPTLQALLARTLRTANPNGVALEDPRTGQKLSYAELDACTRYLAGVLRHQHGVGVGDVVVVAAERRVSTVLSLLSVVRCGAAYMPVDAAYPDARIRFMLQDARSKLILCSAAQAQQWDSIVAPAPGDAFAAPPRFVVAQDLLSEAAAAPAPDADSGPDSYPDSMQPGAVLYTSGSTGLPKAVVIPNGAMARQYTAIAECTGLKGSDRIAQQTTLTFDVAGNEIWGCMSAQATLVLVDQTSRLLGFEGFVARHAITTLFITPSHLGVMSPSACGPTLKTLAVAGEAVPKALVTKWAAGSRVLCNEYGPTETNVVTCLRCTAQSHGLPASIGAPLKGVPLLLVDEFLQPVPPGVPGELCVGGPQVASGYLNREELTQEKFISWIDADDPAHSSHRLYRTGDLSRWLPDGTIEFLGRIDSQVKIRGMRVEVGEIESTLLAQRNVQQCAVLLLGGQLVAFVVVDAAKGAWDERAAFAELAGTLPEHMVPAASQLLEAMPTTSSGKINRKALPALWLPTAVPAPESARGGEEVELPDIPMISSGEGLSMSTFLSSERAQALRKRGVDSLGMVRQYRALVATEAFARAEARVLNCVRAVCMLGVIIDHLANCAPASPCTVVAAKVLFPHAGSGSALRNFLLLLETLMRSIGGYKTIAGFSMASGYIDAGGSSPFKLGMMEAAIAIIYLEMTWVWDPAATAIAEAAGEPSDYPWWLAQHRWYLLSMLLSRAALSLLHTLHVPPLAQVLVAAMTMFLAAPNLLCVSVACAGDGSVSWMNWSNAPQPFNFLLGLFFRGIEPQNVDWPYGGFRYALVRKYLLMVLLYLVSFHYGRAVIKMAVDWWKALQEGWKAKVAGWSGAMHKALLKVPAVTAGAGSLSLLLLSSVWLAAEWGAEEDNWVQEWGEARNEAHLTRLGLLTLVLLLQVLALVATFAFIPIGLRTAGTTTLGAFVAHSYCNVIVSQSIMDNASLSIPPALDYCILLLAAFAIQLFVGPLVHWAIVQHLLLLAKLGRVVYHKVSPASVVKATPSPPPSQTPLRPLGTPTFAGVGQSAERLSSRGSVNSNLVLSALPAHNP